MSDSAPRRSSEATNADGDEDAVSDGRVGDNVVRGAGGVVFNADGDVLLIRHQSGSWVFPKGHIESGEAPLETAVREIEEEAGVTARCDDADETFTTSYHNPRGELRRITWFRMRTDAREPVLREKLFPDGAFVPPGEALERLSFHEDRHLLERLLAEGDSGSEGGA